MQGTDTEGERKELQRKGQQTGIVPILEHLSIGPGSNYQETKSLQGPLTPSIQPSPPPCSEPELSLPSCHLFSGAASLRDLLSSLNCFCPWLPTCRKWAGLKLPIRARAAAISLPAWVESQEFGRRSNLKPKDQTESHGLSQVWELRI